MPQDGDVVYVHYKGFVVETGREFEDSRTSEQMLGMPFGFTLGRSQVMRGWDIALRTMRVGESARVWIRSNYTLSAGDGVRLKGLMPLTSVNHAHAVPEGADVRFEVQLLEAGQGRALTRDGRVRWLERAEGVSGVWQAHPNASAGDEVEVSLAGRFRGEAFYPPRGAPPAPMRVRLGQGLLPRGLEVLLEDSQVGTNGTEGTARGARAAAGADEPPPPSSFPPY
jgi:FKBP-type peptidyl-prolyl cis-trans isomerase 2